MIILVQTQNIQGQVCIFQDKYFYNFQIHMQAIMCDFEHTNHDNHQCMCKIPQTLSEHDSSLFQEYLLNLIRYKNLY